MGTDENDIRQQIVDMAGDEDLLFCDPPPDNFDDCIVGIVQRCGMSPVVCYDQAKVIRSLAKEFAEHPFDDDDSEPEAVALDWFYFNTIGAYVGEKTPVFIQFLEREGDHGDTTEEDV